MDIHTTAWNDTATAIPVQKWVELNSSRRLAVSEFDKNVLRFVLSLRLLRLHLET